MNAVYAKADWAFYSHNELDCLNWSNKPCEENYHLKNVVIYFDYSTNLFTIEAEERIFHYYGYMDDDWDYGGVIWYSGYMNGKNMGYKVENPELYTELSQERILYKPKYVYKGFWPFGKTVELPGIYVCRGFIELTETKPFKLVSKNLTIIGGTR